MKNVGVDEIACIILGKEDEVDDLVESDLVDILIEEEFNIEPEQFERIVFKLLKLTPLVKSAVLDKCYNAFVHNGNMILKDEMLVE